MNTLKHSETEEPTDNDDSWLDQYPVEVLEAALQILKAQCAKLPVKHASQNQ